MSCLKKFLPLIFLVGCQCEVGPLVRACPDPVECWLEPDLENTEHNLILVDIPPEASVGSCTTGMTRCDSDGILFCSGITYSKTEVCDFEDNDCDGEVDEGFDKDGDLFTTCSGDCDDNNFSVNPLMEEICDGIDTDCDGFIPTEELKDRDEDGVIACKDCNDNSNIVAPGLLEICDNIDNNCDGEVDNNTIDSFQTCGPGFPFGQCRDSFSVCLNGELICPGAIFPTTEGCDGIDNDCDGEIDEGLIRICENQCGQGFETCRAGNWQDCTAQQPTQEICDGFDNNCDGEVDEGCQCIPGTLQLCAEDVVNQDGTPRNCGLGLKECLPDRTFGPCIFLSEQPEECNGHDDDCDGVIDGMSRRCGDFNFAGIGQCKLGSQNCVAGEWSECEGFINPEEERCDGEDNNCNGEIDENLDSHEKVDIFFAIDGSGSMCHYIEALVEGVAQYANEFRESEHRFGLLVFPKSVGFVNGYQPWLVVTDLVDVDQFLGALISTGCNFGGDEPSYDVVYDMADSLNPVGISWRDDAYPYIILVTDEVAQSWISLTDSDVSTHTDNCAVGECQPGDHYEIFVFTKSSFFFMWQQTTFGDPKRLIDIEPPAAEEYKRKLLDVFRNVCL